MPRMPTVRVSVRSIHWPGASSDAAVRNMHPHQTRNIGRRGISANISRHGTPSAARSVRGKRTRAQRDRDQRRRDHQRELAAPADPERAGGDADQSADDQPAGHQACRMFSRFVLSSG